MQIKTTQYIHSKPKEIHSSHNIRFPFYFREFKGTYDDSEVYHRISLTDNKEYVETTVIPNKLISNYILPKDEIKGYISRKLPLEGKVFGKLNKKEFNKFYSETSEKLSSKLYRN